MRNKSTVINTIPPSEDYPMGRIKIGVQSYGNNVNKINK